MLTTDRNHPGLKKILPSGQQEVYLVLSEDERAKGFQYPYRDAYRHVGNRPSHATRDLTEDERRQFGDTYAKFEIYPEGSPCVGRFWTQADLSGGCQGVTTMGRALSETYARDRAFYGATMCVHCGKHFPLIEFIWEVDGLSMEPGRQDEQLELIDVKAELDRTVERSADG